MNSTEYLQVHIFRTAFIIISSSSTLVSTSKALWYYAAIGSLYGHVACYAPSSGKARRDWNCLRRGWAVIWWLNYTGKKVEGSLIMFNILFAFLKTHNT